jgi:hypothetical protein
MSKEFKGYSESVSFKSIFRALVTSKAVMLTIKLGRHKPELAGDMNDVIIFGPVENDHFGVMFSQHSLIFMTRSELHDWTYCLFLDVPERITDDVLYQYREGKVQIVGDVIGLKMTSGLKVEWSGKKNHTFSQCGIRAYLTDTIWRYLDDQLSR